MKAACTCHMLACSLPGKGTEIIKQLVLQLPQCGLLGKGKETIQLLEHGLPQKGTEKQTNKQNQQKTTNLDVCNVM